MFQSGQCLYWLNKTESLDSEREWRVLPYILRAICYQSSCLYTQLLNTEGGYVLENLELR
jgi:hypothetical protein